LTKSSKESKITDADAEQKVIDFLEGNGIKPGDNFFKTVVRRAYYFSQARPDWQATQSTWTDYF